MNKRSKKVSKAFVSLWLVFLVACAPGVDNRIPLSQLPDPCSYVVSTEELPDLFEDWKQNRAAEEAETNKNCRVVFTGGAVPSAEAILEGDFNAVFVENGIMLFEEPYTSRFPEPRSEAQGQVLVWEEMSQDRQFGGRSRLLRAVLGEGEIGQMTIYSLDFAKGHAYVILEVSTMGLSDEQTLAILNDLAEMVEARIPGFETE